MSRPWGTASPARFQKQTLVLEEQPGHHCGCSSVSRGRQVPQGLVGKSWGVSSEPKSSPRDTGGTSSNLVFSRIVLAVVRRIVWDQGGSRNETCQKAGVEDNTAATIIECIIVQYNNNNISSNSKNSCLSLIAAHFAGPLTKHFIHSIRQTLSTIPR